LKRICLIYKFGVIVIEEYYLQKTHNLTKIRQLRRYYNKCISVFVLCGILTGSVSAQRLMENLGRGIVAINKGNGRVYISWRFLGTDPEGMGFNVYRSTNNEAALKLNTAPITNSTNYSDSGVDITKSNAWFVKPVYNNIEMSASKSFTLPSGAPVRNFIVLPLQPLTGYYTLHVYVGDIDGDGEYDYIVKRFPDDASNNVLLEAYLNDGTYKWRIDLGPNMEQGNYSANPFALVYDFNSDGKAEVFMRSSEGTKFADGTKIGDVNKDGTNDYRTLPPGFAGYMLLGDNCPEFISMVDGLTGRELARTDYIARGPKSEWNTLWGDNYGNRMSFNFVGVAYFDGVHPSIIASRGEGVKMDIVAWDYANNVFTKRWTWTPRGKLFPNGQSWHEFHNIRIVDLDGDGKDEVSWGVNAIDDNGTPLYLAPSDLGHGDRFCISDLDPDRPGLENFVVQQHKNISGTKILAALLDAKTGEKIKTFEGPAADIGRGDAADIDPTHKGYELFSFASGSMFNCHGDSIASSIPYPALSIWWDGDLLREIFHASDGNGTNPIINKWNYSNNSTSRLLSLYNEGGSYSTKTTYAGRPPLYGDIMGDWREEIICENVDRTELRIFSTSIPTSYRIYTLMHNPAYRACMNPKYYLTTNQTDYYLGDSMNKPPLPNIKLIGEKTCLPALLVNYIRVNDNNWVQADSVSVNDGDSIKIGPQPKNGTWSWSGPDSFSSESREILFTHITTKQAGNYVATYTDASGCQTFNTFSIAVTIPVSNNRGFLHSKSEAIFQYNHIKLKGFKNEPVTVSLYNLQGRQVFNKVYNGTAIISMISEVSRGTYFLKVKSEGKIFLNSKVQFLD
jgi:rhamnogalacturonan endolyase